jgi:hypothetical protein
MGVLIKEDADHLGPPLDLERHLGEHIGLGLVQEGSELGSFGPELIGDPAPLGAGRRRAPARCALSARGNAANGR